MTYRLILDRNLGSKNWQEVNGPYPSPSRTDVNNVEFTHYSMMPFYPLLTKYNTHEVEFVKPQHTYCEFIVIAAL